MHMHNNRFLARAKALWERRLVKILWVLMVAVCCFVLGYTLKPRPSRDAMLRGAGMPAFNQKMPPVRRMPPGQFQTPAHPPANRR